MDSRARPKSWRRRRDVDAPQQILRFLLAPPGMRAGQWPDWRPRDKLDGITVDRRRPRDLDVRIAFLDCRRSALARFVPLAVPAANDRTGRGLRHHRSRPRRYFLRLGG